MKVKLMLIVGEQRSQSAFSRKKEPQTMLPGRKKKKHQKIPVDDSVAMRGREETEHETVVRVKGETIRVYACV